jgi:hypothetical protein
MLQGVLVVLLSVGALACLLVVARMWVGKEWFIQWVKGNLGILLILLGVLLGFAAVDAASYKQGRTDRPLYKVTIYQLSPQLYELEMEDENGRSERYEVGGEQWQLDVRVLSWWGPLADSGSLPAYRTEMLQGRYLSLEQERTLPKSAFDLADSRWIDIWSIFNGANLWLEADTWRLQFMPMVNGAFFSVQMTPDGLEAKPLNDVAKLALKGDW